MITDGYIPWSVPIFTFVFVFEYWRRKRGVWRAFVAAAIPTLAWLTVWLAFAPGSTLLGDYRPVAAIGILVALLVGGGIALVRYRDRVSPEPWIDHKGP